MAQFLCYLQSKDVSIIKLQGDSMFWVILACSRDLLVEVDGLELGMELRGNPKITLTRDGETVDGQRISNKWKFSGQKLLEIFC